MTFELATESAHEVARYLKSAHGATRVLLFGSTLSGEFRPGQSDIDLYFEGVSYEKELAVAGLTFCAFPDLKMDLFPAGHATPDLAGQVKRSGIVL